MEMQDEAMAVLEHAENDPNYAQRLRSALGYTALPKNPQALAFKRECTTWLRAHTKHWNDLNNGFNAIMRENFEFKSVQSLSDDQVPEARQMFERYKAQFSKK